MPTSLDLVAFDQMFRSGGVLHRWTSPPRVVVQNRVLQFTNITDIDYTALPTVMPDTDATSILSDLTWALPQLTGNSFAQFADQQRETASEGDRVRVSRPGLVVVARYEGLTTATGYWGYTRWSWNGAGEMTAAIIMIDRGFDTSTSPFKRSLRAHEFGHALGYNHVTGRASVMNQAATIEPNAFDRDAAKFAFQRPPLNLYSGHRSRPLHRESSCADVADLLGRRSIVSLTPDSFFRLQLTPPADESGHEVSP